MFTRKLFPALAVIFLFVTSLMAEPPVIEDQQFSGIVCNLREARELMIEASDADGDMLSFSLLEGIGSIDPQTGVLVYNADTSGTFTFIVEVSDGTAADTATITDMLYLNSPPQVFCQDSVVYLCQPEEICFDITVFDPDSDPIEIHKLEGIGRFEQLDDSMGVACFMPADLDSADYMFIFRGSDSCQLSYDGGSKFQGPQKTTLFDPCCRDTALITVIIQPRPRLSCPDDIIITDTVAGEYCYELEIDNPNGYAYDLTVISGEGTLNGNTLCQTITEEGVYENLIELTSVLNECFRADTCLVRFDITFKDAMEIDFDIKPTSCPNPLDVKANKLRGSLMPTALLGTEDFDVRDIDPTTILLEGVAPIRYNYEDVTAPYDKSEDSCGCTEDGPDGYEDLTMKFDKEEVISQFGLLYNGQIIRLTITGKLYDGTEFTAYDCMIVRSDLEMTTEAAEQSMEVIKPLSNHPNPFNPSTVISFSLETAGPVKVEIYNVKGQLIATLIDKIMSAGVHSVEWDASNLASGIYFYRLTTSASTQTKKMLLMK